MRKGWLVFIVLSGFMLHPFVSFAQGETSCTEVLRQAEDEFNAGRFYGIPSLLKECIDTNGFSNEQLVRVYLLLTQSYLLIDDPIAAEDSYLKLLKVDPEYIATQEKDAIDVFYLSKKFTSTPIFTPHYKGGVNATLRRIIYHVNTSPKPDSISVVDAVKTGWTAGAGIEWNINDNWGLGGELFYSFRSVKTTITGFNTDDVLTYTESQNWADVPIYLRYSDFKGNWRPYGYIGYSLNLLMRSKVNVQYTDAFATSEGDARDVEPTDANITYARNLLNRSFLVGGGMRYKIGKDFILVDLRYMVGQTDVKKGNLNINELGTRYSLLSDQFRVDNLTFTIGYVRPLYDPRKIKKVKIKSFSSKKSRQAQDEN